MLFWVKDIKMIPKEARIMLKDYMENLLCQYSEDIKKKLIGDEEALHGRPADLLNHNNEYKEEIKEYIEQDEDGSNLCLISQVDLGIFSRIDRQASIK